MNEYCDREVDKLLKPWRPIPSGRISSRSAIYISALSFLVAVSIGASFGTVGIIGVMLGIGAGFAHNFILKSTIFSWLPFIIGYLVHPLWIWVVTGHKLTLAFTGTLAYLSPLILGVHVANQLPDFKERVYGVSGLAHRLQPRKAIWLAIVTLLCAPFLMLIPIESSIFAFPGYLIIPGVLVYFSFLARALILYSKEPRQDILKKASGAIDWVP